MRKVSLFCISACLCLPGIVLADTDTTTTTNNSTPTKQQTKTNKHHAKQTYKNQAAPATATATATTSPLSQIQFSGYVESSYNYLMRSNRFTSGVYDRVFDIEPNGLTLHQISLTLSKPAIQGFGALVNIIAGRDADLIAPYGFKPQSVGFDIAQAYFEFAKNKFDFIGGEFFALGGIEEINPTQDANFSRGILFGYATPNTLLGFRTTYHMNDKLDLIAGINDGWNNIRDTSRRKTIELGTTYKVNPAVVLSAAFYNGEERATPETDEGPLGIRSLLDLVATYNATEKWSFAGNYDYAQQSNVALPGNTFGKATWQGLAGYATYKINDLWRTAFRAEIFNDNNGYPTGVAQTWKEITLTLGYEPIKNLNVRAEFRHDLSNESSFVKRYGGTSSSNQQSYALEGTYQF
jgi:hypothetical protein